MKERYKIPSRLGDVLKRSLDKWNLSSNLHRYELFDAWAELAGAKIAGRSKLLRYEGETLIVAVDHPGWVQELSLFKPQLLEKIRHLYPKARVKNLRFILK